MGRKKKETQFEERKKDKKVKKTKNIPNTKSFAVFK
jgi:hypothetical protein